jgi:hypothetical protein
VADIRVLRGGLVPGLSFEERRARARKHFDAMPPFDVLGFEEGRVWILDNNHEQRGFAPRELSRNAVASVCGTRRDWLMRYYPRLKKDGTPGDSFRSERVVDAIYGAAAEWGFWSPLDKTRGRGCWLGEDDDLVVHLGDTLWVRGALVDCGRRGDLIYPIRPALPRPSRDAQPGGPDGPGATLLRQVGHWSLRRGELDQHLLAGQIGQGWVAAALPWRVHGYLTGERGHGKTSLLNFCHGLHGQVGLISVSDPTPAGIWQAMGHDALPGLLDELEADSGRAPLIIKLLRQAADGGKILRGGADQRHSEFCVRSPFLCSAINMPPLAPADRSRICQFDVLPSTGGLFEMGAVAELGRRLHRRMLDRWVDFRTRAMPRWRAELLKAGWDGRGADCYGTLLALSEVLLEDELADASVARLVEMLEETRVDHRGEEVPTWRSALDHELGSMIDLARYGQRAGIGTLLLRGAGYGDGAVALAMGVRDPATRSEAEARAMADSSEAVEARNYLGQAGVRIVDDAEFPGFNFPEGADKRGVAIANRHRAQHAIFVGTPWEGTPAGAGGWRQAFLRTPGAVTSERSIRFGGVVSKAVVIPLAAVLAGLLGLEELPEGAVDPTRARWRPDDGTVVTLH